MILNNFFDNIYVINLKESVDRKNHIINEFNKMKISKYEFFEAVHYDDNVVQELLNSKKVMSFPPCFRCLKNRCNCENNFLTKYQIANWCSYIKLFNQILSSDDNIVLICEDDIVFSKQSHHILNTLLHKNTLKKYKINLNFPLLIKMGAAYNNNTHYSYKNPSYIKNYSLSNPCFAVNKEMIKIFLYNLKIIDYHSDIYFHDRIPKKFPNIQMLVMNPFPVYELSFVKSIQQFDSLVRPKNQIRKKEYKDFLFVTMNKLIEYIPLKYSKNFNLKVSASSIDFNGTINFYYCLNDHYKFKFFFQNKIFIYDNIDDDIILMKNDIIYNNNCYILFIIKLVINTYKLDINDDINSIIDNLKYLYKYIISYFEQENFNVININEHNIFTKYDFIKNYINIKNNFKNSKLELNEAKH